MSEHIDRAAEAERLLTRSGEGHGDAGWGGLEDSIRGYGLATLALVEQQRIANLIALGRLQIASGLDGASTVVGDGSAFRALYPGGPNTPLAPGIARALRIGDGNE